MALQEAKTIFDVLKIKDLAEAARVYAKAARLSQESVNMASEIAILAARKAGEILAQLPKSSGGRPAKTPATDAVVSIYKKTLKETKTPERTAEVWQTVAAIPEKDTKVYFAETKKAGKDCSTAGLLRFARGKLGIENKAPDKSRLDKAWEFLEKLYHDADEIERENELNAIIEKWKSTFTVNRNGRIVPGSWAKKNG